MTENNPIEEKEPQLSIKIEANSEKVNIGDVVMKDIEKPKNITDLVKEGKTGDDINLAYTTGFVLTILIGSFHYGK